jgi:hypothetical protein
LNDLMRLQITYDLPPSLAKILVLLVNNEVVTARMIELDERLTKDAKVAVHRLRRRLEASPFTVNSRRDVGYWIDDAAREILRGVMKDSARGGGAEGDVGGSPQVAS